MTVLFKNRELAVTTLKRQLGMTDGNLASHLAKLSEAGYVKIDNDSNASYTFNINSYPIAVGGKPGGLVLGMIHLF